MKYVRDGLVSAVLITAWVWWRHHPSTLALAMTFGTMITVGALASRLEAGLKECPQPVAKEYGQASRATLHYFAGDEAVISIGVSCLILGAYFWYLGLTYAATGIAVSLAVYLLVVAVRRVVALRKSSDITP